MNNFDPITRKEHFLAKMGGQDVNNLEPITREEVYLAKAGGQDVTVPDPITREEFFLEDVIENISQGGGSSDFTTAVMTVVPEEVSLTVPWIIDVGNEHGIVAAQNVFEAGTYNLALYKGRCGFEIPQGYNVTGNAEISDGFVTVTGDFSVIESQ